MIWNKNIRKAKTLDKRINKWQEWTLKCKTQVKELKKEYKQVINSMNDVELLLYSEGQLGKSLK